MTTYMATVHHTFEGEPNCGECRFGVEDDCGEAWCTVADKYLAVFHQHPTTMVGNLTKLYRGLRPTWCPLEEG